MACMLCCTQMGTNTLASQKGMTSYGTRRHLYDSRISMDNPQDKSTISLQMGTNKGASQVKCCSWMLHHRTLNKLSEHEFSTLKCYKCHAKYPGLGTAIEKLVVSVIEK